MAKKYRIRLAEAERTDLKDIVKGKGAAHKRRHAHILLLAYESADGKGMKDEDIAVAVLVTVRTVERVRTSCLLSSLNFMYRANFFF